MKQKILSLFTALCIMIGITSILPVTASAAADGECGENLTWSYNNGILTVSGTGSMYDYESRKAPWYNIRANINEIIIEDNVSTIGENAFQSCYNITDITMPEGIESIGYRAFYGCSKLTGIEIPTQVTSIGTEAFSDCTNLISITIPASVTSIGENAFYYCSALTNIDVSNDNVYYSSADGVLFNKDKTSLIQYPVGKSDTEYTIPEGVTSICDFAFAYCSALTTVNMPISVTSIGNSSFQRCSNLSGITIPDSVVSIGDYAFSYCSNLMNVSLGNGVSTIGENAFASCFSIILDTAFPDSVTSIGKNAFVNCQYITKITIPKNLSYIGSGAFSNCSGISDIYVDPENSYYKSENGILFDKDKTTLILYPPKKEEQSYTVPDNIIYIGDNAFSSCANIKTVTIPDSVTSIGNGAFAGCENLENITIPNSVTSIGHSAFSTCLNLDSIIIPVNVTSMGESVFSNCDKLINVTITGNIPSIEKMTFYRCTNLASITIPDSVTSIGDMAFSWCNKLRDVYYGGSQAQWNKISIKNDTGELRRAMKHYTLKTETKYTQNINGTITLDVTLPDIATSDTTKIFAAGFDDTRSFVSASSSIADNTQLTLPSQNISKIKVFVWSENMKPLTVSEIITIE